MLSQKPKRSGSLSSIRDGAKAYGTDKSTRARRALAEIEQDKRGWIRHGIAALAIAGLGLAAAGAVAVTGSATEAGPSAPGVSVGPVQLSGSSGARTDGTSRSTGDRQALTGSGQGNEASSGTPLDGTVDMAARREAQKHVKVTDTSTENSAAAKAAQERAKALQEDSSKAAELSSKLSKQEREQKMKEAEEAAKAAAAAGNNGTTSGTTGTTSGTTGTTGGTSTDTGSSTDTSDLQATSSSGGAALPVSKGAYSIAATFGQVGSWSRYHTGVDFAAPIGTPIHATGNGVITNAGIGSASSWAGNYVVIKFSDGQQMLFAHMSSVSVSVGQQVSPGQLIGHVGMTGRAFGPHTHVELYPAGITPGDVYSAVNPMPWFTSHGLNP